MECNSKGYFAKLGVVLLKLKDNELMDSLDLSWIQSEQHEEYYDKIYWLHSEVEKTLKSCPDIRNVERLSELRKEHFEPFIHYGEEDARFIQESSSILSFDVFLPKSERKYAFDVRYDERVIENARVLYNGNIFLAYSKCDDEVSSMMFGQEIREFLLKCLKSKFWDVVCIPPCPFHPDINVHITNCNDTTINSANCGDICIEIPNNNLNINIFFEKLFYDLSFSIVCFASASTLNQRLDMISREMRQLAEEITTDYEILLNLDWKSLRKKFKIMHDIRCKSLEIQVLCNEFTNTE